MECFETGENVPSIDSFHKSSRGTQISYYLGYLRNYVGGLISFASTVILLFTLDISG